MQAPETPSTSAAPASTHVESPAIATANADTDRSVGGFDSAAWRNGYTTPREERSSQLPDTASLPHDLVGTYYRNGGAKFEVGENNEKVMHPFDADGMVAAATFFGNGSTFFRNRFVRTRPFQKEILAGKMLYPGQFGNPRPVWAGGTSPKNVANTNVIYWGGRLLALWEGGQPHKLDPLSLGTAGPIDLGGVVLKGQAMTAHPRYDSNSERLVAFDYKPSPVTGTTVRLFEFESDFSLADNQIQEVSIPNVFGLFHDVAVTKSYYVFSASPQSLGKDLASKGLDILLGRTALGQSVEFDDTQPTKLVLFRRDGADNGTPVVVDVDTHFNFHYANAFENDAGEVVVDTVRANRLELGNMQPGKPVWETVDYAAEVPKSTLTRYVLNPRTSSLVSTATLSDRYLDFPVVNPRVSCAEHRYVWAGTGCSADGVTPIQGVIKVDTTDPTKEQVWLPEPHEFCGEPVFAPRAGKEGDATAAEDDGYIISLMTDGRSQESSLVVLDAADISKGPIAKVPVGVNMPHGLHGCWVPGDTGGGTVSQLVNANILLKLYMRKSKEWNQLDASFSGMGIGQFFGQRGLDGR